MLRGGPHHFLNGVNTHGVVPCFDQGLPVSASAAPHAQHLAPRGKRQREVTPDDVVLSYALGQVRGAGFARSYCYTCPRPAEFGHTGEAWEIVGWRADVNFRPFSDLVRPKHHLPLLVPLLEKERFAPLRSTGDGLQHVYLTSISRNLAEVILGLADPDARIFAGTELNDAASVLTESHLAGQQECEAIEQRRIMEASIPQTTRQALARARIGQGLFRERVLLMEHACRITFVTNPTHLIGSHIKPWRECTNEERLEGANGLLPTPTADHLFDRGFISFEDSGAVLVSPVADVPSLRRMGLDPERPPYPLSFNSDQKHFLAHHRREVFLSAAE